jgi:hypothetical protein
MKWRWETLFVAALALGCLLGAGMAGRPLRHAREAGRGSPVPGAAGRGAPPMVELTTVMLSGFRGIVVDWLWLRIAALQDQGDYAASVQLADWITQLDPESTETWVFHAWNMADQFSSTMTTPEDRWRWIWNGIRLLRDEGVRLHGDDPDLYAELALIYYYRIGADTDVFHLSYKQNLARLTEAALGGAHLPAAPLTEVQRQRLDFLGMDEAWMRKLERQYGLVDWRMPQAHALYWAARGRVAASGPDTLKCDRVIVQSMAALVMNGRLEIRGGALLQTPDPALYPFGLRACGDYAQWHPGDEVARSMMRTFLMRAVLVFAAWPEGRATAADAYARLKSEFPGPETAGDMQSFISHALQKERP